MGGFLSDAVDGEMERLGVEIGRQLDRLVEADRAPRQTPGMADAEELLRGEESVAWLEYLEATRGQSEARYRDLEPWAWARLSQRLRAIKARRAKLARQT